MNIDTHTYDGKLNNSIIPEILKSDEEKKEECHKFITLKIDKEAKLFLSKIIKDIGTKSNFDSTNKLDAGNILYSCIKYIDNEDFVKMLEEQLLDMKTGFCPQGRTHRLYQLFLSFSK